MDSCTTLTDPPPPPAFSKWRQRLWPVHPGEFPKLFLLLLIKCCASFNFTILHATKDTLIVTGKGSGAEVIPILKGWLVFFAAFIFMIVYSKLSNIVSRSKLFYLTLAPFFLFFLLYGFCLYPYRDALSPQASADWLLTHLGPERSHWVAVYRNWIDAAFFLMAELWGGVVIGVLFWGLANRISTMQEATRFYTLLSAGGHLGVIVAGPLIWHYAHHYAEMHYQFTLQYLISFITLANVIIIAAYAYIDHRFAKPIEAAISQKKESKPKLSLSAGLKQVLSSPSLGGIALMVIGYGLSVNMIEVIWKAALKLQYPEANEYQAFMGVVSLATGLLSLFLAIVVSGNVIRRWGWFWGAQSTPFVLGITSFCFLFIYWASYHQHSSGAAFSAGALTLLVGCGALHNVACKSMKYCLFDPTKEMAYITLDEESKVKGKAAVDVVAARFGKSGSSWLQIGLMELSSVGSVLGITMHLAPFILLAIMGWSLAIYFLHHSQSKKPISQFAS